MIRGFIVERKTAGSGFSTPKIEGKLSLRASVTGSIQMDNAFVSEDNLFELWEKAKVKKLTTPNIGLLTDIICCPGGDFCSLANAKSIPIAKSIQDIFDDMDYLHDIGEINLNISFDFALS